MTLLIFLILSLATFRILRLIIEDAVLEGFREWVWKRFPPETSKLGYILTCYWCLGFWISGIVVVLYLIVPIPTLIGALILAISAAAGLIDRKLNE